MLPPTDSEFDRYAASYGELDREPAREWFAGADFFHKRKLDVLLPMLAALGRPAPTLDWLDFGCGQGHLLQLGSGRFSSSAGCDVSQEMLSACRGMDVRLQTDPGAAPYPDASFDLVTAVCVYHHVPPPDRPGLTREITRILRPNGMFALIEHNPFNPMTQLVVKRSPVDENAILLTAGEAAGLLRSADLTATPANYFLYVPAALFGLLGRVESLLKRVPLGGQYIQIGVKRGN